MLDGRYGLYHMGGGRVGVHKVGAETEPGLIILTALIPHPTPIQELKERQVEELQSRLDRMEGQVRVVRETPEAVWVVWGR